MLERCIDLIHNYCDRWCERCAFTERCSVFMVDAAISMCGDTRDGLELVFGEPPCGGEPRRESPRLALLAGGNHQEDGGRGNPRAEHDETGHENEEWRREPLGLQSREYMTLAFDWTRAHRDAWYERGDAVLRDALDVVSWDATLIGAKVDRALFGRARAAKDGGDEDPVQNDANGSAKVALISLERSEAGWALIADATGDVEPAALGRLAWALRRAITTEFPSAASFVRPGFDE